MADARKHVPTPEGSLKVWGSLNATQTTIDDDLGVSSVTDHGTGDATWNFAANFANANYAITCNSDGGISSGSATWFTPPQTKTLAVGSVRTVDATAGTGTNILFTDLVTHINIAGTF